MISGSFPQVVEAFDLVSDILYTNYMHGNPGDPFTFHVMIEHAKAGRVVGPKVGSLYFLLNSVGKQYSGIKIP